MTALSILRLIAPETGRIVGGSIRFDGRELTTLSNEEMRALRGHRIAMIFQEPMTSLNPVLTIGTQIAESVVRHMGCFLARGAATGRAKCSTSCASPMRAAASTSIRTSSPAACASAS